MAKEPNYFRAAFLMPANLFAMGAAAVGSLVSGEPMVLVAALGLESLYLGLLSNASTFKRAVRANSGVASKRDAERESQSLLEELSQSQKEHYLALRALRDKILANHQKLPGGRVLAASSEQRVDALLNSFLRLVSTLNHYRKYLSSTDRKQVERELAELEEETKGETNPRLLDVKQKRVEILKKRVQRFQQAEESRELVSHQLAGIEDLLKLTHEQSIAIRDPESLGRQLDVLAAETQATEESVKEMERFIEFTEESGPQLPSGVRVR
jgi:hypothetical protein